MSGGVGKSAWGIIATGASDRRPLLPAYVCARAAAAAVRLNATNRSTQAPAAAASLVFLGQQVAGRARRAYARDAVGGDLGRRAQDRVEELPHRVCGARRASENCGSEIGAAALLDDDA